MEKYFNFFNGEEEKLFDQSLIKKNEFAQRAILKRIKRGGGNKDGQSYGGEIESFDEEEIMLTKKYTKIIKKAAELQNEDKHTQRFYYVYIFKGNGVKTCCQNQGMFMNPNNKLWENHLYLTPVRVRTQ
jgi:hypothetical protein